MSEPWPPVPMARQLGPGLGLTGRPPMSLSPSDSRRVRPDDTGQLHSAHGRAVGRPQPKVAAGVDPLEQNLAVKEGQVAGREARRIRSADRGQFKGPAPRAVRLPRTTGIERVLASKKTMLRSTGAPSF